MAKLNPTKIGQGVLIGLDVTIGGLAYQELVTNMLIGVILTIFAIVLAMIAFAPELETLDTEVQTAFLNAMKAHPTEKPTLTALLQDLKDAQEIMASMTKVDTAIGNNKSFMPDITEIAATLQPIIEGIIAKKSVTAEDMKNLAPLFNEILVFLNRSGAKVQPGTALPEILTILTSPEAVALANQILSKIL